MKLFIIGIVYFTVLWLFLLVNFCCGEVSANRKRIRSEKEGDRGV